MPPVILRPELCAKLRGALAVGVIDLCTILDLLIRRVVARDAQINADGLSAKNFGSAQAFFRAAIAKLFFLLVVIPNVCAVAAEVDKRELVLIHLLLDQAEVLFVIPLEHSVPDVGRAQVIAIPHGLEVVKDVHRSDGIETVERIRGDGKPVLHDPYSFIA